MRPVPVAFLGLVLLALGAGPSRAFHLETPPITPLSTSGDNMLPRLPAQGTRLVMALAGSGRQIYRFERREGVTAVTEVGQNDHPTVSRGGTVVAWDSDCNVLGCTDPGEQIFLRVGTSVTQITHDPTGTSVNPSLNGTGSRLAFESMGGLAGGGAGIRHVFLRSHGSVTQVSRGLGTSRNPSLSRTGRLIVFDSTSHPVSGADTGVPQIWIARDGDTADAITAGLAPSERPVVSGDAKVVAWESRAALASTGADTGVTQIFAYRISTGEYFQVTNHPSGCHAPAVDPGHGDWRIGFSCAGKGYLHMLRANTRTQVPIDSGDTIQAIPESGAHFVVVSTTANLLGSGTTPGHQLYLVNLYKRPATPVPSDAIQF
jgi:hypothetical protein